MYLVLSLLCVKESTNKGSGACLNNRHGLKKPQLLLSCNKIFLKIDTRKNTIFVKFARDLDTPLGRSDTKTFEKSKEKKQIL